MALNIECTTPETPLYQLTCSFSAADYKRSLKTSTLHHKKGEHSLVKSDPETARQNTWNFIMQEAGKTGKIYCQEMEQPFVAVAPKTDKPVPGVTGTALKVEFTIQCGDKLPASDARKSYQRFVANATIFRNSRKG